MRRHITAYLACVMVAAIAAADTPTSIYLDHSLWITSATASSVAVNIAQPGDVADLEVTVLVPPDRYEADAERLALNSEHAITIVSVGGVPYLSAQLTIERVRVAGLRLVDGGMAITFDTAMEW